MSKTNLVIYHSNCTDGFTAAWAAWKCLGDDADYVACSYGTPVTDLILQEYVRVYIVDFSFPRDQIVWLCDAVEQVYILDHHKTAQADLANWDDRPHNLWIHFDMNKSGAMLAWEYFWPNREAPELVKYVQDRDLWKKELTSTEEITAYISCYDKEFEQYDALYAELDSHWAKCVSIGAHLLKQTRNIVADIVRSARPMTFHFSDSQLGPITGLAANCTGHFASDVGHELCKLSGGFGATYCANADGSVKWSLRSEGDYDVSKIAKYFGGGGHRNAAGFTLTDMGRDTDKTINLWIGKQPI